MASSLSLLVLLGCIVGCWAECTCPEKSDDYGGCAPCCPKLGRKRGYCQCTLWVCPSPTENCFIKELDEKDADKGASELEDRFVPKIATQEDKQPRNMTCSVFIGPPQSTNDQRDARISANSLVYFNVTNVGPDAMCGGYFKAGQCMSAVVGDERIWVQMDASCGSASVAYTKPEQAICPPEMQPQEINKCIKRNGGSIMIRCKSSAVSQAPAVLLFLALAFSFLW